MAKGQKRSTKEPKKPKQVKPKTPATAGLGSRPASPPAGGGRKA
ncbi:MAG: hypothetical protein U1E59_01770 [Amaricoccus sp.]